jgi:hypothetical protein
MVVVENFNTLFSVCGTQVWKITTMIDDPNN